VWAFGIDGAAWSALEDALVAIAVNLDRETEGWESALSLWCTRIMGILLLAGVVVDVDALVVFAGGVLVLAGLVSVASDALSALVGPWFPLVGVTKGTVPAVLAVSVTSALGLHALVGGVADQGVGWVSLGILVNFTFVLVSVTVGGLGALDALEGGGLDLCGDAYVLMAILVLAWVGRARV